VLVLRLVLALELALVLLLLDWVGRRLRQLVVLPLQHQGTSALLVVVY
jgi:hypothetical protein